VTRPFFPCRSARVGNSDLASSYASKVLVIPCSLDRSSAERGRLPKATGGRRREAEIDATESWRPRSRENLMHSKIAARSCSVQNSSHPPRPTRNAYRVRPSVAEATRFGKDHLPFVNRISWLVIPIADQRPNGLRCGPRGASPIIHREPPAYPPSLPRQRFLSTSSLTLPSHSDGNSSKAGGTFRAFSFSRELPCVNIW
jgi:hypothetical protein